MFDGAGVPVAFGDFIRLQPPQSQGRRWFLETFPRALPVGSKEGQKSAPPRLHSVTLDWEIERSTPSWSQVRSEPPLVCSPGSAVRTQAGRLPCHRHAGYLHGDLAVTHVPSCAKQKISQGQGWRLPPPALPPPGTWPSSAKGLVQGMEEQSN